MPAIINAIRYPDAGFTLDISASGLVSAKLAKLQEKIGPAHEQMIAIESGAIKNPDENRKVTHFTERVDYPQTPLYQDVDEFFINIRDGKIRGSTELKFEYAVFNGIGGSALGPQLMQMAINGPYWNELTEAQRTGYPRVYFIDNTDPAGLNDLLKIINLESTLVVTISKSGATQETKNNLIALEQIYREQGIPFPKHAAAITMKESELDAHATANNWLKVWHMAESIGGRTSVTSVVGHVPAAAAGIDFKALITGATTMDEWTRSADLATNPAYLLAAVLYALGNGRGDRNMVIIPYSDRLILLSRYLQQLVMESLGKELDRDGKVVHQGVSVFGNKGGTDAHAFVQQLNDGRNDFVVTFIEVLKDARTFAITNDLTMGDYLHNFLYGLITALRSKKRSVLCITIDELNEKTLGMLIALYERAVAFYAELININAFHQPGVQAYKLASRKMDELHAVLRDFIARQNEYTGSAQDVAAELNQPVMATEIDSILTKFSVNNRIINGKFVHRTLADDRTWLYTLIISPEEKLL